jgi:hypothetical protein
MRVFCLNDIAFFYYNVCITTQRRTTTDISFFLLRFLVRWYVTYCYCMGVVVLGSDPTFVVRIHTFLSTPFFTTPLSCLLRNLVLLSVVVFCLCTTKFFCADFLAHKFFWFSQNFFVP